MKEEPKAKLYPDKTFIAKEIIVDKGKMIVRGEEGGCSYYTNVIIQSKNPIKEGNIEDLRQALSEALEKSKGE
ncbi:MAG TPA: hypothetical protein VFC23_04315 [Thermoanaerobaculia bacterium]|nr:hypothetical protein [Thermoanaerobaculia bacterium]